MSSQDSQAQRYGFLSGNSVQDNLLRFFSFSNYATTAILLTIFPIYFQMIGFNKMQTGILFSIGPAMGIFANLIWGMAADRFQTTKKVITLVLLGELAMILLLFQFRSFPIVFGIMAVFYFFQTPVSGLNDSQILLKIRTSGKSYASFRVWGSIGFAFSSVLFGMLLKDQMAGKISLICILTISVGLILCLLIKDSRGGYKKMDFTGLGGIVLSRKFLMFLFLILLLSIGTKINDGFLSLYLVDLGASPNVVGLSWMASALSEIPMFILLGRYGDRFRELPLLAFAGLMYGVRFLLMLLPHEPGWIIAIQCMHSVSFGIFLVTALRYIQQIVPDKFRATGQALFNVTWSGLSGLIAGSVGGRIFDVWGGHALYTFAAVTALVAAAGFAIVHLVSLRRNAAV